MDYTCFRGAFDNIISLSTSCTKKNAALTYGTSQLIVTFSSGCYRDNALELPPGWVLVFGVFGFVLLLPLMAIIMFKRCKENSNPEPMEDDDEVQLTKPENNEQH